MVIKIVAEILRNAPLVLFPIQNLSLLWYQVKGLNDQANITYVNFYNRRNELEIIAKAEMDINILD